MPRAARVFSSSVDQPADQTPLVDATDCDTELFEALRDLRCHQNAESRAMFDQIRDLSGPEMQAALLGLVESLDSTQREELIATSSEEEETCTPGSKHVALAANVIGLGPPRVQCPRGHTLSGHLARPSDYDGQPGKFYECDLCGDEDLDYSRGVYHCAQCRDWDACVVCAGTAIYEMIPAMVRAGRSAATEPQKIARHRRKKPGKRRGRKR